MMGEMTGLPGSRSGSNWGHDRSVGIWPRSRGMGCVWVLVYLRKVDIKCEGVGCLVLPDVVISGGP